MSRVIIGTAKWQSFQQKSIQATFSGEKVKKQLIQRTDEAKETSKGTMPEQCLITMNFFYIKKRWHEIDFII